MDIRLKNITLEEWNAAISAVSCQLEMMQAAIDRAKEENITINSLVKRKELLKKFLKTAEKVDLNAKL